MYVSFQACRGRLDGCLVNLKRCLAAADASWKLAASQVRVFWKQVCCALLVSAFFLLLLSFEAVVTQLRLSTSFSNAAFSYVEAVARQGAGQVRRYPSNANLWKQEWRSVQDSRAPKRVSASAAGCKQLFYMLSHDEAEDLAPSLQKCIVTTESAAWYKGLVASPCSTSDLSAADLVVLPSYLAANCNWPHYRDGQCMLERNHVTRSGKGSDARACYAKSFSTYEKHLIPVFPQKRIVIMSHTFDYVLYDASPSNASVYADPSYVWVIVGTDTLHYRKGIDVSMPPLAPITCCDPVAVRRSFEQKLEDKSFFATFLGNFGRSPVRSKLYSLINDNKTIIVGDGRLAIGEKKANRNFYSMMYETIFSLVVRGDTIKTFRFSEAVCSGGIPVLITDVWVPPFEQLIPFEEYGILHDENDLEGLLGRLRRIPQEQREALRSKAFEVCQTILSSWDKTTYALGRILGGAYTPRIEV
eukprot:TRINITY_DN18141_c0_g1_i3.p1 TRINITY_DN18141_c0_g1~~TRINITY_DN18141_c0_g1_i3.p1  ORF type:complete len:472 (-),score=57.40 TRINITY_DN18141_c0_g1_i3:485-1900(-)